MPLAPGGPRGEADVCHMWSTRVCPLLTQKLAGVLTSISLAR